MSLYALKRDKKIKMNRIFESCLLSVSLSATFDQFSICLRPNRVSKYPTANASSACGRQANMVLENVFAIVRLQQKYFQVRLTPTADVSEE